MAALLLRWQEKYPKLCAWVEENVEKPLTFYRLPREHHKHLKSTKMLEVGNFFYEEATAAEVPRINADCSSRLASKRKLGRYQQWNFLHGLPSAMAAD